ncbi:hypothetical protein VPHF99_0123 [Vibrio phage F99]|nr:hypothetical protein MYOV085v1_p0023 [Vibrio phage 355E48.1]
MGDLSYNVYNKSGNTSEAVVVADLSLNRLVAIKCACHSLNASNYQYTS